VKFDKLIQTVCAMPEFQDLPSVEQVALIKASTLWQTSGWFSRAHVSRLAQLMREQYSTETEKETE
jgi:hypothetical protein